jgi:hypothetical protein
MNQKEKVNLRKWWREARPTKTAVFWYLLITVVLTVVVGFVWGGWVTDSTAQKMAKGAAQDAVTERLASICVAQFNQAPGNGEKLEELKNASAYQRDDYVRDQGWATMLDEDSPDRKVVDECVKLLLLIDE